MIQALRMLFAISVLIATSTTLRAATILDTGPISAGEFDQTPVNHTLWRAHHFAIEESTSIDSIEGYLMRFDGEEFSGELKATVYSNGVDELPEDRLFEKTFVIPLTGRNVDNAGWYGASELGWVLPPGDYWVAFVVDEEDSFFGRMPFEADQGVRAAGWTGPEAPPFPGEPLIPARWSASTANLGFRVSGVIVPEPINCCTQLFLGCLLFVVKYTRV